MDYINNKELPSHRLDATNGVELSAANGQITTPTNRTGTNDDESNHIRKNESNNLNITNKHSADSDMDSDMDLDIDSDTEACRKKFLPETKDNMVPLNEMVNNNITDPIRGVNSNIKVVDTNENSPVKKERFSDMRLYLVNYCFLILCYMSLNVYNVGVIRTIERKYGFHSAQSGFIMSMNDISHIMVVIFVGYFGKKTHKPRFLSISLLLCALAALLLASPYFIFKDNTLATPAATKPLAPAPLVPGSHYSNVTHNTYHVAGVVASSDDPGYCDPDRPDYQCSDEEIEKDSANMAAYYIFLVAQVTYFPID